MSKAIAVDREARPRPALKLVKTNARKPSRPPGRSLAPTGQAAVSSDILTTRKGKFATGRSTLAAEWLCTASPTAL